MVFTIYTLDQAEQWNTVVRSFKDYDTYWLSNYVKAFRLHGDGEPVLFYCELDGTRGLNVFMKRDVASDAHFQNRIEKNRYFDVATPYGYGGWLIEGENRRGLFETYERWVQENNIICEFVRFHPLVKNHEYCKEFYEVIQLGEVVHMELSSPELVWNNIVSKNRNMIRKAIKNDVKVYNGRFPEIYEIFRNIYNSTMDKDNADKYYYFNSEFYNSILEDLDQNAQVFWAQIDGKVIAASIILTANSRMNYHLSGSLEQYRHLAPSNLILYKAALWGVANGFQTLYLGGGIGSAADNLFRFKKAFNRGELNNFFVGKKIYDVQAYNELVHLREPIRSDYFPKYRA